MKHTKQLAMLLVTAIIASLCQSTVDATAASIKLNKTKIQLTQGETTTLKVKGAKKKAKWTIKSGKKNIRLISKKKKSVKVKALKVGTAKVQCRIGKKKLVCKVTVKAKKNTSGNNKVQTPQPACYTNEFARTNERANPYPYADRKSTYERTVKI